MHSLYRAVSANFQSDPISCQQTNVSRKCNTLSGRVYYQHLEPGKLHIFLSAAGNFIVCTSKEGLKGLPLKAGPAQVSALFWSLQKKKQSEGGGGDIRAASNVFPLRKTPPALHVAESRRGGRASECPWEARSRASFSISNDPKQFGTLIFHGKAGTRPG